MKQVVFGNRWSYEAGGGRWPLLTGEIQCIVIWLHFINSKYV